MWDRGIGKWILPQPKDIKEYVAIPKLSRVIPFGYEDDLENEGWLKPIPLQLDALEKAKKHINQYSFKELAAWLTTRTGRYISPSGFKRRVDSEQSHKRKATTYRKLAAKYEKALRQAEIYEEKTRNISDNTYFDTDTYRTISRTFTTSDT